MQHQQAGKWTDNIMHDIMQISRSKALPGSDRKHSSHVVDSCCMIFRKFVVPRVLQQSRRREEDSGDEEDEQEDETEDQKRQRSYMNFVENPEDVRARYAQKRMANMKHPPGPGPRRDVVGTYNTIKLDKVIVSRCPCNSINSVEVRNKKKVLK